MRRRILVLILLILGTMLLASCREKDNQKITCTICNGTGEVKYYYGEGDNDYNMGPCTSCDEKGYVVVNPSGVSVGGKNVICGSCKKYVEKVITKADAAGEDRTWCSDCWDEYDAIMGR